MTKTVKTKKTHAASSPNRKKKTAHAPVVRPRKFEFTKMVASGNDFIVFDNRRAGLKNGAELAARLCPRTSGIGADGLIFIEQARRADFKMRIFNPDGSEAAMCGNGIRCAALYKGKKKASIETMAGTLQAEIGETGIKVKMTDPRQLQTNVNLDINGRMYQINFVDTGVPHAVYFVDDIETADVRQLGRLIRYHRTFGTEGTNVDFVKAIEADVIAIRTYERGVEAETLACGTGSTAAALLYHNKFLGGQGKYLIHVHTHGKEILKVYFEYGNGIYRNVWLEGTARIVYKGECYV